MCICPFNLKPKRIKLDFLSHFTCNRKIRIIQFYKTAINIKNNAATPTIPVITPASASPRPS